MFDLDFKAIGKWLHISVTSPAKEYFVAVFEDITERKRAEEELRHQFTELTKKDEEIHALNGILRNAWRNGRANSRRQTRNSKIPMKNCGCQIDHLAERDRQLSDSEERTGNR